MANTTIYDVAGAAKVSLATVSRVMNNPEKVNPETREKVLKVIKELGYRPNAIARGLASRKTTTVGIVMADVSRAATGQEQGHSGRETLPDRHREYMGYVRENRHEFQQRHLLLCDAGCG